MTLQRFVPSDAQAEAWRIYAIPIVGLLVLGWLVVCGILGSALALQPAPGERNIPVYSPALRREVRALQAAARELRAAVKDAQAIEAVWRTGDTSLTSPALVLQEVYGRYDNCQIWTWRLCQVLYLSAQATFMAVASPDPEARARAEELLYAVRAEALLAEQRLLGHPQAAAARLSANPFRVPFAMPRPLPGTGPAAEATPVPGGNSPTDVVRNRLLRGPGE